MTHRISRHWIAAFAVACAGISWLCAQSENETAETVMDTVVVAPDTLPEEPSDGLHPVPEEYLGGYLAERPSTFLVDPQRLLTPTDSRERQGFLDYHAGDSAIDLYVYLFAGDQRLPDGLRMDERAEGLSVDGRPVAVLSYHLGAPERATLALSAELDRQVPVAEQRRALESAAMQAAKEVEAARQLQAFLVQMSIRLYWMEDMLGLAGPPGMSATPTRAPVRSVAKPSALMQLAGPWIELARPHLLPAGLVAGFLFVTLALGWWIRRNARYNFPEFQVEPRLGGPHCAGVGGVISFANPSIPPDFQRDQIPEYLRRA